MKLVSIPLTILVAFTVLTGCSAQHQGGVGKNSDSEELFQKKSIAAIGLNHRIALTFDDGPTKEVTDALLEYLRSEGIKASFFIIGDHVAGNEATMRKMQDYGMVVGNHTQHHIPLPAASVKPGGWEFVRSAIADTADAIAPYRQPGGRLYFRAPEGAWLPGFADRLNADPKLAEFIGPMFWDVGGEISYAADGSLATSADWHCWTKGITPAKCAEGYLTEMDRRDGGISLMHDVKINTLEMLKILVPEWRRRGYTFVTLDEVPSLDKYTEAGN